MKMPFCRLFLLVVLLAWSPLHAEVDRYAGSEWTLVDAKQALAAANDITLVKFPNCDEATVEQKIVDVYRPDGTSEIQDEAYVKVLTEKGKRDHRTLDRGFMLPYSTVAVVKIEVVKPSGQVVPIDIAANSKETIDNSQISSNIYDPNSKILQVNIPGLEAGDVLHWVTRTTTLRPIMAGEFADENVFEGGGYIRHIEYVVHAPLAKPLKRIQIRDEIPGTIRYSTEPGGNDTLVHRWEVTNVPRMFAEPMMPPYENVLQRVLVSTTPEWQDVSKWYWELSKAHLDATSPEMKETVARLTAGARDDMEKVKALFYYVSQKIRYMGLTPEKDRPGYEPHDVCVTFGKKYGVCRDKAALLVAMLRTAGLKAYPVLVSVGSKQDPGVPDAWFNHAIAGVELAKGAYVLMDPTDEHARDLLPQYDCDQSYLVARPEGENLAVSPIKPASENLMRIRTTGILSTAGELDAKSELWFDGANDDIYRNGFSHMKPDDLRRYFETCLKKAMPGARLKSLKITPENMLDVSKGIHAEMEFAVDGMTANGGNKSIVSLPWIGNQFGVLNFILKGAGLEKRKYPLQTEIACGLDEQIALQFQGGLIESESMPTYAPVEDDCISYHQSASLDGELKGSRSLQLKVVEFTPVQYLELKKTLQDLDYAARKAPVLTVKESGTRVAAAKADADAAPVDSNAKVLSVSKELEVTDPHTAVYRVKYSKLILTYAGKIREAEVKVSFNPACGEAKLVRGVVTSKNGQRQEISPAEINVMDEAWSASAKRYTGGKILVANLPGVDIGSTIEVEYEITMKNTPFISGFEAFQLVDELQQKSFHLTAPAGLKIEKLVTGGAPVPAEAKAMSGSRQNFTWTASKMKALPAEQQLPPEWLSSTGVSYFIGSLPDYLKTLNETLLDRARSCTKAAAAAKEIGGKSADKLATLKGIRDFVAMSVRLAGPNFSELPLSELSAADVTLADGYGHSADRAILLHAMLTAAGFQPQFVLASDLPSLEKIEKVASSFPLPDAFDEPLVKVAVDGVTYYLNDTDQYAKLGSTAHTEALGLDIASGACEVIKAAKGCEDRTATVYTLSLADNGNLRMGISKQYYGEEFNRQNRYLSELRPEERKRYYQEIVSAVAQGARPVGELTSQFDTYPGTVQYTVDLDNYAVVDGKYLYFNLPFTPQLFTLPGGDRRSLPILLSDTEDKSIRTEINLPPGFQQAIIAPKSEDLTAPSDSGTVQVTSTSEPGKIVLTDHFETSPAIVSPPDYPALLKVESKLEKKSARTFLLEKR